MSIALWYINTSESNTYELVTYIHWWLCPFISRFADTPTEQAASALEMNKQPTAEERNPLLSEQNQHGKLMNGINILLVTIKCVYTF